MRHHEDVLLLDNDPLWYQDAVIYELHVRTFHDSDGDGIGDFRGLTQKLDYLQDLGVTTLWLLPFCASPLRDDGYDIADYSTIHPHYGSLRDFRDFLRAAHQRGLRVITELVVNHTSDQHPWFQRARRAKPGSRWRNFYVWSDTPDKYKDTRIIFKDFEPSNWSWDPVAHAYYWHRFYAHQPDLNYESPQVQRAIFQVLDFWFSMGVDGLRLDAVPYLYERDGTSCENLPETHAFLQELRRRVDAKFAHRVFLAEANQWPEDTAVYFGAGDECHMNFHFPLMPRLFMALRMEDRYPIVDILQQTPAIPANCQWATFLRNHDELTLEMVTNEERDYMYRAYAQDAQARLNLGIRRRLAPLLGNDRRTIELLHGLLFALPGTPVLYYGDEIGMGDNVYLGDRNGVRTPMQWSTDRNAGFSRANPQRLCLPIIIDPEYHYEAVNVETQQHNPHSLLWWMKRLISARKRFKAFGRGTLEVLQPENRKVLAFVRRYQQECLLVVANLSRHTQYVELDLAAFQGMVLVDPSSRTRFPAVREQPYFLTLSAYAFYWFVLEAEPAELAVPAEAPLPLLTVRGSWDSLVQQRDQGSLAALLPAYLQRCRWFGGKARTIHTVEIVEAVPVLQAAPLGYLTLLQVTYTDGEPETYVLPLAWTTDAHATQLLTSPAAICRLRVHSPDQDQAGVLYDAMWDQRFTTMLLSLIARSRRLPGTSGELRAAPTRPFRALVRSATVLEPLPLKAEQSNTSVVYGDMFVLKLYRRLHDGVNPDLEVGRYLTEDCNFRHIAPVAGALEWQRRNQEPLTLATLQVFLPALGDAWRYTQDAVGRYFTEVQARQADVGAASVPQHPLLALLDERPPPPVDGFIGPYLESARLLGQRTGELHVALAQASVNPSFAPAALTDFDRQGLYQSMLGEASQTFRLLRERLPTLPPAVQREAQRVLACERDVRQRFRALRDRHINAMCARIHGDYHLGQVLYTGKDFIIIDFEGEPARPISVRRLKQSPLRDVAGMLRSFHYAVSTALLEQTADIRPEDLAAFAPWARVWYCWVSAAFMHAYCTVADQGAFLPPTREERQVLLDAYLLEKALYELRYELNSRPDWVNVPLQGILDLVEAAQGGAARQP
jgi:maltose alpha-D-glucosyltransferase / alpha-amylase